METNEAPVERKVGTVKRDFFDWPLDYVPDEYSFENDEYWSPDETVYYLASRGSGKSTFSAAYLLARRHAYANVFCMTNTSSNNYWQQFIPEDKVLDGYSEEMCSQLLDLCEENLQKWRAIYATKGRVKGTPYNAIIFEDLINGNMLRSSPAARRLFYNGRHAGLSGHIISQDYVGLTPGERDNVDRLVIFRTVDRRTRDALRAQFGQTFMTVLDRVTAEPYTALLVNNRANVPMNDMVRRLKISYNDTVGKALRTNKVLGNKACWGDCDLEEQRARYIYTDYKPSYAMMKRKWNEAVADSSEEDDGDKPTELNKLVLEHAADEEQEAEDERNVWKTLAWADERQRAFSTWFSDWW